MAWPVLCTLVLAVVFGLGVVPTRSYLDRREKVVRAEQTLDVLQERNARSRDQVAKLQTDAEIERLAREQYRLVKKGEEPYRIQPSPQAPRQIPEVWPFERLKPHLG